VYFARGAELKLFTFQKLLKAGRTLVRSEAVIWP